ncbi:MAG: hypothetical protein HUU21_39205 [Polyangiaceae bacterium]|nr:hypothetical protein [Polyangiaceae bacterium]NUQ79574.1 hypothetical protein [Polyangiaceae bacterium]
MAMMEIFKDTKVMDQLDQMLSTYGSRQVVDAIREYLTAYAEAVYNDLIEGDEEWARKAESEAERFLKGSEVLKAASRELGKLEL